MVHVLLGWHTSSFIIVKYDITVIVYFTSFNFYYKLNLCQAMSICLAKEQYYRYCERLILLISLIVSSDYECNSFWWSDRFIYWQIQEKMSTVLTFNIADLGIHPYRHQVVNPQNLFVWQSVIWTFHFTYLCSVKPIQSLENSLIHFKRLHTGISFLQLRPK